ncbi:MAG: hypothetical protein ACLFQ8_02605 [Candidatus Aenigmatarchaeota archaeon]
MYSWKKNLPFCSGRLQKIAQNLYETGICDISEELDWYEIAINRDRLEEFDLEPPINVVYTPRNSGGKGCWFNKTPQRKIRDPENVPRKEDEHFSEGYAIISKYDNYIKEILEEGNLVFNTTPETFKES